MHSTSVRTISLSVRGFQTFSCGLYTFFCRFHTFPPGAVRIFRWISHFSSGFYTTTGLLIKPPSYNKTRNQTFGEFWKIIRPREEKLGAKRPKKIGFLLFYKGKSPKNMIKNWHIIRPFSVNLENFWKIIKP